MRRARLSAGVVAAAAVGGAAYAALWPRSQIFGRVLVAGNDPNEVALTYDDGPNPTATPHILDVLARHGVRATFFLIGGFARLESTLTRRIVAEGHAVGNHSMTHPWLAWQSEARIRSELGDCSRAIEDATGERVRYFRPPHGARRPVVLAIARELGMVTVQWNTIVEDWQPVGASTIVERVERGMARNRLWRRGSNVVLHDGGHETAAARRDETVEATRQLLATAAGRPWRFVTPDAWVRSAASQSRRTKEVQWTDSI